MTKVKITKELAKAIEDAKEKGYDIYSFLDQMYTTYGDYVSLSSWDAETVASAWVNGYEVIETIEEKIRKRILDVQKMRKDRDDFYADFRFGEIKGLEFAYDLLMEDK